MKRTELYDHIKGLGLQKEVESRTGKNFTRCSNGELEIIVIDVLKSKNNNTPKQECCNKGECKEAPSKISFTTALDRLLEVLHRKNILLDSELRYILQLP